MNVLSKRPRSGSGDRRPAAGQPPGDQPVDELDLRRAEHRLLGGRAADRDERVRLLGAGGHDPARPAVVDARPRRRRRRWPAARRRACRRGSRRGSTPSHSKRERRVAVDPVAAARQPTGAAARHRPGHGAPSGRAAPAGQTSVISLVSVSRTTLNQRRQPDAWHQRSRERALRVVAHEQVVGPRRVVDGVGVGRGDDPGLSAVAELGLVAWPAPRARDEQHQWAATAAPCSSISAPVVNRSSPNGRLSSCGSSWAIVWARTSPDTGVALNPPVPQPQLRYSPPTGESADDRRGIGRHVDDPGPRPQQVRAREDREQLDQRGQLALDDVERAALAVAVPGVDAGADHQLALVRLADVDVDRVGHDHGRLDRLEQLGDERLERMALERQPDAGHPGQDRGVAGRHDRDAAGGDRPARGLHAGHPTVARCRCPVTSAPSIRSTPSASAPRA